MKIKDIQNYSITKELYKLKELGVIPTIRIRVKKDGSVSGATLNISSLAYYFHKTLDKNRNDIDILVAKDKFGTVYEIPFDGWGVSGKLAQEIDGKT